MSETISVEKEQTQVNEVKPLELVEKPIAIEAKKENSLFINETDTFDVEIEYYFDNNNLFVKDVDESFDTTRECKKLVATFKQPSFNDAQNIFDMLGRDIVNTSNLVELIKIQDTRMVVLLRSWNIDRPITELSNINTKISKTLRSKVNAVLGMEGIF